MNNFVAAGFGCVAAIALWKGTKERLWPTLAGMFVIALTVKYAVNSEEKGEGLGWVIAVVGYAVFTLGAYGLKRYDARVATLSANHILAPKSAMVASAKTPDFAPTEEPEYEIDVTTAHDNARSGWERWTVFPKQKRLICDSCSGGPPRCEDIYEYAVRHASVFVHLIEKSSEGFDGHEYDVFGGSVNRAQLDADYAKKKKKWGENDALLEFSLPEKVAANLQKQIEWHELYGAVRYFILEKDGPAYENTQFLKAELERFTAAFAAFDKQVQELGAVYNTERDRYDAPDGTTREVQTDIRRKLHFSNFGFRIYEEFSQKDDILRILNTMATPATRNS